MAEAPFGSALLALAALAGLCCGLPVLLAAGSGVVFLGLGLRSWVLIVAGLMAALAGLTLWRRERRRAGSTDGRGEGG